MDKLIAIKIKKDDGTYSENIPFYVDASNISWNINYNLIDVLGEVDLNKGDIQTQLLNIFNILNFDEVPTKNSNNMIKSGTIYESIFSLNQKIDALNEAIFTSENLYKGAIKPNGYYDRGGAWIEDSTFCMAELPVGAVKNGDTLYFSKDFPYYQNSYLFDVFLPDGTWIKRFHLSNEYKPVTISIPSDYEDFYVAMRIRSSYDTTKLIISKSDFSENKTSIDVLKHLISPLSYKVINCLGDSFTAPSDSWCQKLSSRIGCKCNNYGISLSRIAIDLFDENNEIKAPSFLSRYNTMDQDADITIIFGGINDAASIKTGDLELGNINSALNNTTFYGALKLLITNIKSYMPGKKIIGIIPPDFAPNANYQTTLPLVQQACRDVYEMFLIPYCDLKKECQEMYEDEYNNNTYRKVSSGNWHPSSEGHNAISEVIQGVLNKYINC